MPPLVPADDPVVYSPLHWALRPSDRKAREGMLFFAGRICGDGQPPRGGRCSDKRPQYSGGTRQQVCE